VVNSSCGAAVNSNTSEVIVTPLTSISSQPITNQTVCQNATPAIISLVGAGTGTLTYQWYSNTVNSNIGGTLIGSANSASFTPPTNTVGTQYYYCTVNSACGTTVTSAVSSVLVNPPISITTSPLAKTPVCQNSTFNASVIALNATSYQWQRNGINVASGTGGTSANYSLSSVQPSDAGIFRVVLNGLTGCPNVISNNDTLVVTTLAAISTQPITFKVCEDQSISITGNATNAASYQWLFNGSPISAPNGIAQTYTKGGANATMSDSGLYRLVAISNSAGATACKSDTSTAVLGQVVRKIQILTQPPATSIGCIGLNFSMSIAAQNVTSYSWRLNGNPIGQTTSTMTRTPFMMTDSGTYTVVMNGNTPCPSVTSANAKVNPTVPALIVTEPSNKEVCLGDSIVLSVSANATQFYQWRKNGVNIGGPTASNVFKIPSVLYSDSASYSVIAIAFNGCVNDTSLPAVVKVRAPLSFATPLANTDEKCENQSISYSVAVVGAGPYTYSWSFNGNPVGTNSANYSKSGILQADSGSYIVRIQGNIVCPSSISDTLVLTVRKPLSISLPLAKTDVKCVNQSISYSTAVSGSGPFTYSWTLNGTPIGINSPNYSKSSILISDSGRYIVSVQGSSVCSSVKDTITLKVNQAPIIVTQPNGSSEVCFGSNVTLAAGASNYASLEWHRQGFGYLGQSGLNYSSTGSSFADSGNYFVIAKSLTGCSDVTSNTFNVKIIDPAIILNQPQGAELLELPASAYTISVVVKGKGPNSYQWYKNGNLIVGATSPTFSITNYVEATDSGLYYCVITAPAPCNTALISATARISTLKCPKVVSQTAGPISVCVGNSLKLIVNASSASSYQWLRNNIAIVGETDSSLNYSSVGLNNSGTYTCQIFAANSVRCSTILSAPIVVNVKDKPIITKHPDALKTCSASTHSMQVIATFGETYQWFKNGQAITLNGNSDSYIHNSVNSNGDIFYVTVGNNVCPSVNSNSVEIKSIVPANSIFLTNNSEYDMSERCTDVNEWTYYSTTSQRDKLLFAIKKNNNAFVATPDLEVMSGIREISSLNSENRGAILGNRIFNLDISGVVDRPYDVKFYYNKSEADGVVARLNEIKLANPNLFNTERTSLNLLYTTQQPFTSSLWNNLTIPFTIQHNFSQNELEYGVENGINYVVLKNLTNPNLGGTFYMDYTLKSSSSIASANSSGFRFSLYPVPTTDGKITVEVSTKKLMPITFTLTDMTGRVVAVFNETHSSLDSKHSFDFSQLANGNYQLILSNDEESAVAKFTISK
jgi:hypothetical protein